MSSPLTFVPSLYIFPDAPVRLQVDEPPISASPGSVPNLGTLDLPHQPSLSTSLGRVTPASQRATDWLFGTVPGNIGRFVRKHGLASGGSLNLREVAGLRFVLPRGCVGRADRLMHTPSPSP